MFALVFFFLAVYLIAKGSWLVGGLLLLLALGAFGNSRRSRQ